jgi:HD-GYP domain-containing protein (c-di-GMP phosphodiesterase class II)
MTSLNRNDLDIALATVRQRCSSIRLPSWRINTEGQVIAEPIEEGIVGLVLRSGVMSRLVVEAARRPAPGPDDPPQVLFPGCWLIRVPEVRRRKVVGYTLAMAMGPEGIGSDELIEACVAAQVDPAAGQRAFREIARFNAASVQALAAALRWGLDDQNRVSQDSSTIVGFTRQLTECYETIDLLYSVGRSMTNLDDPMRTLGQTCRMLHEATPFGWVAMMFGAEPHVPERLRGHRFIAGSYAGGGDLAQVLATIYARVQAEPVSTILSGQDAGASEPWAQVVVQPLMAGQRAAGVLVAGQKQGDDPHVSSYDTRLLETVAGFMGAFIDNAALYAAQQRLFLGTIETLAASIDAKDQYTAGHSRRVAHLAWQLASRIGFDRERAERVRICGLVHDVGKIGVPEAVLCKPGRLTDEEFALIKKHPEIGHRILKDIPQFDDVLPGVLHHHERWDGRGYPAGLKGEQIPLVARILALADTFDAMSSNRSYRPAMSRERVIEEFRRCSGQQFDPVLVEPFVTLDFAEFDRMLAEARDLSFGTAADRAVRSAA